MATFTYQIEHNVKFIAILDREVYSFYNIYNVIEYTNYVF